MQRTRTLILAITALCMGAGMPVGRGDAGAAAKRGPSPRVMSVLHQLSFKAEPASAFSLLENVSLPQGGRGWALVYAPPFTHIRRIAAMPATVAGKTVWMRGLVYRPSIPALPDLGPINVDSVLGNNPDLDLGFSDPIAGPNKIYLAIEYMLAAWSHMPVEQVPDLIKRSGYVINGSFPTRVMTPSGDYVEIAPSYVRPGPPETLDLRRGVRVVFRMHGQNEGLKINTIPDAARLQIDGGLTAYRAGMYSDGGRLTFFKYARNGYFQVVSSNDYVTVAFDLHNLLETAARKIDETSPPAAGSSWEDDYLTRALSGDTVVPLDLFLQTDAINHSIYTEITYAR